METWKPIDHREPFLRLHGGFARLLAADGRNAPEIARRGGRCAETRRAFLQKGVSATHVADGAESGPRGAGGDDSGGNAGVSLLAGAVCGVAECV